CQERHQRRKCRFSAESRGRRKKEMNARTRLLLLSMALAVLAATLPFAPRSTFAAQQPDPKKEAQLRTVHGVTMDKGESPVPSAVVFLKNTRSNAIRSYISDDQGNY